MFTPLLIIHRWLALILGAFVIVVAASGAAISFEGAVRESQAAHVTPGGRMLSLDSVATLARNAAGGGALTLIDLGGRPDRAWSFALTAGNPTLTVNVNPYTGEVLPAPARSSWLARTVRRLHQLHTSLLAGHTGSVLVGFVALASLVLVATGLLLWWRDRLWRVRWSASWKRVMFDLHHALGMLAAVVLLVICGTAVTMRYGDVINRQVLKLNRDHVPAGPPIVLSATPGAAPIGLDSIMHLANAAVPGAPATIVELPADGPAIVTLRYPEDHTPAGRSRVYIDRYRGTVLRATNTRTAGLGTWLLTIVRPLHTGEIFGTMTQVIWLVASLILASQAVTGTLMWWNGRAGRAAARARAMA